MTQKDKETIKENLMCEGKVIELFFGLSDNEENIDVYISDDIEFNIEYSSEYVTYFNKVINIHDINGSECIDLIKELFPSVERIFAYSDNCGSILREEPVFKWWKEIAKTTDKTIKNPQGFVIGETDNEYSIYDGDMRYLIVIPDEFDLSSINGGKKIRNFTIQ